MWIIGILFIIMTAIIFFFLGVITVGSNSKLVRVLGDESIEEYFVEYKGCIYTLKKVSNI